MASNAGGRQKAATGNDFPCNVEGCSKSFKRKEHLVRHRRNHDETSPLVCKTCGRGFARSDIFNRHLRQHGQGAKVDAATLSSSIACDTCHDRKVKCPGGTPCKNCDLHGNECTRNREVKRRRPTRIANQDQSPPHIVVLSEGQASTSARDPDNLIISTMSNRNAAMGFIPRAPLTDHSVSEESSSINTRASSLRPQKESENFSPQGVVPSTTSTQNYRLSHFSQFRIPNQQTSDPNSFDTVTINKLLETFFALWHPRWPVLHRPSFDWRSAPWELLWVVFMIAAKLQCHESNLPSALQDEMAKVLKEEIDQTLEKSLCARVAAKVEGPELAQMQTSVLYILFVLYFGKDVNFTHANSLVVSVVQHLQRSGMLQHPSLHEQTTFGTTARTNQEAWRMAIVTTFIADVYISTLRRRPPTLRYHELNFPLPGDKWLTVAGFQADVNRPTNDSWRTVNSIVQQCLEDTERGLPSSMLSEIEHHLVCCAIRPRLWDEKLLGSSATMAERRIVVDYDFQSPRLHQHGHRRLFWRQTLGAWRSQAEKAYWTQEASLGPHGRPPRSSVGSLNSLMNHLSVLEMWSDIPAITRIAESTPGQDSALSSQDRELIQLQLLIWASSFHGRLSIWHATQILRHFSDKDEFTVTISGSRTLEPVAKQAYYSAGLVLWAFCLDRRSCPECVATADTDHQAAHAGRPTLELSFLYEPDFYVRWIQKEGRFTFEGVLLCECRQRNILNKVESVMMLRGGHDAVVGSKKAVLLRLRDNGY